MGKQFKKIGGKKILLGLVIVLLGILVILFLKDRVLRDFAAIKEAAKPKKGKLTKAVLRSSLAGRWYPGDAETLSKQLESFFQKAEVKPINNVIAFILPHAGYQFSGQTAALGLKTTEKKYKRVVVIGPSHYGLMEEVLSVPRVTHYETPIGQTPLDLEFIENLLGYSMFQNIPMAHKNEHSVQIELPLLQFIQKDFKFVPIVAGRCSLKTIRKTGAILRSLVDDETLVIASSDFVHYGPNYRYVPFIENVPEEIKKLDMGAYEHIAKVDCKGFWKYKQKTGATICGSIPVAILLSMLEKGTTAELIKYTTSGELTGDFSNSVSYLSVAFSGAWQNRSKTEPQASNCELSEVDKKQLLALARETMVYALEKGQIPQASELDVTISDKMREPGAAFVTLKKNSQLRGCIGDIFPQRPLYKSVIDNAVNACVNDRRFLPVTKTECNDITIEISALTVPKPVGSADEIRIGIDGIVLSKNGRSAVFLPQVAPEQGWDLEQTLTYLSSKAGLAPDAWKEGARFLVFQAVVFGEEE